jgi:hypothetical protein
MPLLQCRGSSAVLLLLLSAIAPSYAGTVISNTDNVVIYGRNVTQPGEVSVMVMGVGTACSSKDYSRLANAIVDGVDNLLVAIADPWSPNLFKNDPKPFKAAFDSVKAVLITLKYKVKAYYVGGHSAGGQAAANAIKNKEYITDDIGGFIGWDPYKSQSKWALSVPALIWTFSKASCFVEPSMGGGASFYDAIVPSDSSFAIKNDVKYTFQGKDYQHCIFTDYGCLGFCKPPKDPSAAYKAIALSIGNFISGRGKLPDIQNVFLAVEKPVVSNKSNHKAKARNNVLAEVMAVGLTGEAVLKAVAATASVLSEKDAVSNTTGSPPGALFYMFLGAFCVLYLAGRNA